MTARRQIPRSILPSQCVQADVQRMGQVFGQAKLFNRSACEEVSEITRDKRQST